MLVHLYHTMPHVSATTRISSYILDILFPRQCLVCAEEGRYLCLTCESFLDPFEFFLCPVCSKKIPEGKICKNCRGNSDILLSRFFTLFPYHNPFVKTLIQRAKYKPWYAKEILEETANLLVEFLRYHKFHDSILPYQKKGGLMILPVPLHKTRIRSRSFNQAEVIGSIIAKAFSLPFSNNLLMRTRNTESQTKINPLERKINVHGAFQIALSEQIAGKIVILVDDVFTSGATMNECAKILRKAGAKQIWGITLAR